MSQQDHEFNRILSMTDAEIEAELRADGIDPNEAAARILARVNERLTAKGLPPIGGSPKKRDAPADAVFWMAETTVAGRTVWWPMDPRIRVFATNAVFALHFTTREECEAFIRDRLPGGWRATEHAWSV